VELLGGHATDAPQALDRQRMQEVELAIRRHEEEPVRLGDRTRDLGEELRARDPDRDRQSDLVEDALPQAHGDLARRPGEALEPAHVEERLVDREALDERRRVLEHGEHRLARVRVGGHPRSDHDGVRTEPTGLPAAHGGANSVRLRLVARCEHDAAADDDWLATQSAVVALLDRREEGVEVGVEDGGRA